MRFSENGYYVERYVKCANCGLLIYDQGIRVESGAGAALFCSDWARLRESGETYFRLKIVQPTIKTSHRG